MRHRTTFPGANFVFGIAFVCTWISFKKRRSFKLRIAVHYELRRYDKLISVSFDLSTHTHTYTHKQTIQCRKYDVSSITWNFVWLIIDLTCARSCSITKLFNFNDHNIVELAICVFIMHLFADINGCHCNEFRRHLNAHNIHMQIN